MNKQEIQQEALTRATGNQSLSNYPAIIQGFIEKGIAENDIKPRINIFTFNAWKALGRSVKKGEHGVKVLTWITGQKEVENENNEKEIKKFAALEDVSYQSALDTLEAEFKKLKWDDAEFLFLLDEWELL